MSSLLLWLSLFLIPAIIAVFLYSLAVHQRQLTLWTLGVVFLTLIIRIAQWSLANRARCPLCMVPSLANKGCSRHRNARRLFGSYRLRVATTILFRNYFRCPYCGEPTTMKVRTRKSD